MRVKDIWWSLALIIAFIIFIGVFLAPLTGGTCRNGYVWVDDERGRGCIPWEGVDK